MAHPLPEELARQLILARIISDALADSPKRWSDSVGGFRRRDADGGGRDDRAPEEVANDRGFWRSLKISVDNAGSFVGYSASSVLGNALNGVWASCFLDAKIWFYTSMALARVTELVKQAASNKGILNALQNDPARIRQPLQLSEAHVRALMSAGGFSAVRPALTTSQSQYAAATEGSVGPMGTLQPPEGFGLPGSGEIPPVIAFPNSPTTTVPAPSGRPKGPAPTKAPNPTANPNPGANTQSNPNPNPAPMSGGPGPASKSQGPSQTSPSNATPATASPTTTVLGGTPSNQGMTGVPSQSVSTVTPAPNGYAGVPSQAQRNTETVYGSSPGMTRTAGCCASELAMLAIFAQVSTTAQTAITAITAIAALH